MTSYYEKQKHNFIFFTMLSSVVFSCSDSDNPAPFANNQGQIISSWSIPVENVLSGQIKDGIPSVDNPKFVTADEAAVFMEEAT